MTLMTAARVIRSYSENFEAALLPGALKDKVPAPRPAGASG